MLGIRRCSRTLSRRRGAASTGWTRSPGSTTSCPPRGAFLAALLDNATGLVNGTFQDVTSELPTLGLSGPVLSALMNAPISSDGLFGAPISLAQPPPPPPPSCSGFGCAWNTVSGVVAYVVNGVTHLSGTLWNAVQAVGAFFATLSEETGLSSLVEAAVAATAAALTAVAAALAAALAALTAYILSLAKAALGAVVSTFGSAFRSGLGSWASAWTTTTGHVDGFYLNGDSSDLNNARAGMWSGIGGLFLVMMGLATALAVVTTVAAPLDIGADVIVPLLLTVVMAAFSISGLGGALGLPQSLLSDVTGSTFRYFSDVAELLFNLTQPESSSAALAIAVPDGDPFVAWGAIFSLIGVIVGMFGGAEVLVKAAQPNAPYTGLALAWMGSILAFAGIALAVASVSEVATLPESCSTAAEKQAYQGDAGLAAVSLGLAMSSLLFLFLAVKYQAKTLLTYAGIGVGIAVAVTSLLSIADVHGVCGTY